jgi:hypothetical protein
MVGAISALVAHAVANRVLIFALKRQNVSQKGFNALVHWFVLRAVRLPVHPLRVKEYQAMR